MWTPEYFFNKLINEVNIIINKYSLMILNLEDNKLYDKDINGLLIAIIQK